MEWPDEIRPAVASKPGRARLRPRAAARTPENTVWNLDFESVGTRIPAGVVAKSPTLLMVAIEDVCWRVAMDTLRAAQPSRLRRRAYAAWHAKVRSLDEKRERLRSLVDETLADS
jgi:hypothetical protein